MTVGKTRLAEALSDRLSCHLLAEVAPEIRTYINSREESGCTDSSAYVANDFMRIAGMRRLLDENCEHLVLDRTILSTMTHILVTSANAMSVSVRSNAHEALISSLISMYFHWHPTIDILLWIREPVAENFQRTLVERTREKRGGLWSSLQTLTQLDEAYEVLISRLVAGGHILNVLEVPRPTSQYALQDLVVSIAEDANQMHQRDIATRGRLD